MDDSLFYKNIFKDICAGFSAITTPFGKAYIKHINFIEQSYIEENRKKHLDYAKSNGLPTVQEALANLEEEGFWTKTDESKIAQEELFIKKIQDQKKTTYLKSQIDVFNAQIEQGLKKLNALKNTRNSYLGNTCENYADQKNTEDFLKFTLFKDSSLKESMFLDEEFDEIPVSELGDIISAYNKINSQFSDLNIQKTTLQDFFSYYSSYSEDPIHFFGLPVTKLTFNQLRLLIYARYFKNIFMQNDKMPEEYRKDPEKIFDYVNANEKAKDILNKEKDGQAQSIVGATKEDYKYLNMDKGTTKTLSLAEEAKKKGGSLDMNDLMKIMGA
jgi:hypothetical protein